MADLAAVAVSAVSGGVIGQPVTLSWSVQNLGNAAATAPWTDKVYLSPDGQLADATLLTSYVETTDLPAGSTSNLRQTVTLPDVPDGNDALILVTNALNQVYERNTANNTLVVDGALSVTHADLVVANVSATLTGSYLSGGSVTVDWDDDNIGTGATTGSWIDTVTVVNTATETTLLNGADVPYTGANIPANGFAAQSYTFTLPNGDTGVGNIQVTVTANANHALFESNFSNNTGSTSFSSTLAPYPNLVVGTVSAPSTTVLGQSLSVSWTDVNEGTASATGPWVDRIYLYASPTDTNPTLIASVPFNGTLAPNQTASLSSTVSLPVDLSGSFYFGVTTDYFDQVTEASTVRRNTTISSEPTLIGAPALVGQSVSTSPTGQFGQPITVTWMVTNNGSAPATGSWSDQLYLSTQQTLNASAVLLTTQDEGAFSPLAVDASYTATSQATLPLAADLSAGQYYVIVVVNADQTVAEVSTSQVASQAIDISLPPLPALGVSGPTAATHQVYAGQLLNLSWTVTNNGTATAAGPWNDEVFLATNAQGGNETLLGTFANGGPLTPSANYTSDEQVALPAAAAGQGWLVVTADPNGAVLEPGTTADRTQIDSQPLTFATYSVSVQTSIQTANAGTPIPFTGSATNTASGQPAPNTPVAVQISTDGFTRTISAMTDTNGNFRATFQPLATETGIYQFAAGPPTTTNDTPQGQFEIVGMTVSTVGTLNVAPGVPLSGNATITNLGSVALTGLTSQVVNAPANINVQISFAATNLPGSGSVGLSFTVTASDTSVSNADVIVVLQSVEGALTELTLPIAVAPLVPVLAAQPGTLLDGMLVGTQTLVEFDVVNNGGAASGPLQVLVPQAAFLSLTSPATIGSLAPGQSTTVTLQLLPDASLALGSYTGTISLAGTSVSLNVPFQFTAVSSATGDLVIDAEDEMSLMSEGGPLVAGASVIVSDPQTGDAVASGTTGSDGTLEFDQLPVGIYNVNVQASGHNPYQGSVTIQPGLTSTVDAFMTSAGQLSVQRHAHLDSGRLHVYRHHDFHDSRARAGDNRESPRHRLQHAYRRYDGNRLHLHQ